MRKTLLIFLVLLLSIPVIAQEVKFKDVDDNHWAAKAVYNLVRAGLTQGFPDGTFRGTQKISRYEAAVLISTLATTAGLMEGIDLPTLYKAQAELKAEIDSLKAKLAKKETGAATSVSGSYYSEYRAGNFTASGLSRTPAVNYRLKTNLTQKLSETSQLKINLDTMDRGFDGGSEGLANNLLDIEGKLTADSSWGSPLVLTVKSGPGPQVKGADAQYPVRSGTVYDRPRNSLTLSTQLGDADISGSYIARGLTAGSPSINVNHFKGYFKTGVGNLPYVGEVKVEGQGDILMKGLSAFNAKMRAEVGLEIAPAEGIEIAGLVGLGDIKQISSVDTLAIGGKVHFKDYFKTGTEVSISGLKSGSSYLPDTSFDAADLAGLNIFDKYNQTGYLNLDSTITQKIGESVELSGKGNIILSGWTNYGSNYAGTSLTLSGGVDYKIAPNAVLGAKYTLLNNPSSGTATSDLATLGLIYKF